MARVGADQPRVSATPPDHCPSVGPTHWPVGQQPGSTNGGAEQGAFRAESGDVLVQELLQHVVSRDLLLLAALLPTAHERVAAVSGSAFPRRARCGYRRSGGPSGSSWSRTVMPSCVLRTSPPPITPGDYVRNWVGHTCILSVSGTPPDRGYPGRARHRSPLESFRLRLEPRRRPEGADVRGSLRR